MNLGLILRVAGTIGLGVALVLSLVHGNAHTAAVLGYGGGTALGVGTLVP